MEKMANDVVIVEGVRTPFAKVGTQFKNIHAAELGQIALQELIAKTNLDVNQVDEVIIGCVGNPSDAVNIGRVVALRGGIPLKTSAHTVHRNCASALESISSGFDKIKAGMADVVIAGGTENMSQAPLLFNQKFADIFAEFATAKTMGKKINALKKVKLKYLTPRISIVEALNDPFVGMNMGDTAEILAKEFHITRLEQDEYALRSHQKAVEATKNGHLAEEITPVYIGPKYKEVVKDDIGPRDGQTLEALGKLKPYFDRKTGTVTVGNACPLTDGAAVLLMMSRKKAEELGYKPIARIRSYAFAGLEPERMGLGPVHATPLALKKAGLKLKDMNRIELNEAFAAQVLACAKAFASKTYAQEKLGLDEAVGELDMSRVNVNGGAIALGHPVGATGTRLVLTLIKEMKRSQSQFGLATLCIGGGQGGAMIVENEG
jgi:acetyl-CoA acyltransferase